MKSVIKMLNSHSVLHYFTKCFEVKIEELSASTLASFLLWKWRHAIHLDSSCLSCCISAPVTRLPSIQECCAHFITKLSVAPLAITVIGHDFREPPAHPPVIRTHIGKNFHFLDLFIVWLQIK